MATNRFIRGLSGAGFRVPDNTGALKKLTENGTLQVDIDDRKTQLILNGERDNFIRVSGNGATTATIVGLTRKGFRIQRSSDSAWVTCKIGVVVTVDITKGPVKRTLRRNYGRFLFSASATSVAIRGTFAKQNGFDVKIPAGATATISSTGTNPADNDTVVLNDRTYRFKNTLALANDVKIGANSDATLDSLVKATNLSGIAGTDYFAGTAVPTGVTAAARVGTGATGKVTFTATAGAAGNAFASTDSGSQLSFTGTTFSGGTDVSNANPTKIFRAQSATTDPSVPFNYQNLRRHYLGWIEG